VIIPSPPSHPVASPTVTSTTRKGWICMCDHLFVERIIGLRVGLGVRERERDKKNIYNYIYIYIEETQKKRTAMHWGEELFCSIFLAAFCPSFFPLFVATFSNMSLLLSTAGRVK